VDFPAAVKDKSSLLAVDATVASSRNAELPSVGVTDAFLLVSERGE
jgi:hypothetical protein